MIIGNCATKAQGGRSLRAKTAESGALMGMPKFFTSMDTRKVFALSRSADAFPFYHKLQNLTSKEKTDEQTNQTACAFRHVFGACMVLPFLTGQIPKIGSALSPMHIPVLICGFACGGVYGAAVGFIAPFLRNLMFHMPPILTAVAMAVEMAVYGLVAGLLYKKLQKTVLNLYLLARGGDAARAYCLGNHALCHRRVGGDGILLRDVFKRCVRAGRTRHHLPHRAGAARGVGAQEGEADGQ